MTAPEPRDADVAAVAKELTKAQREAVLALSSDFKRTAGAGKGVYKSAALRPLVEGRWSLRSRDDRYNQSVRLLPLGLAVRKRLLDEQRGAAISPA